MSNLVMVSSRCVHLKMLTPSDMASTHLCARMARSIRPAPRSSCCICPQQAHLKSRACKQFKGPNRSRFLVSSGAKSGDPDDTIRIIQMHGHKPLRDAWTEELLPGVSLVCVRTQMCFFIIEHTCTCRCFLPFMHAYTRICLS